MPIGDCQNAESTLLAVCRSSYFPIMKSQEWIKAAQKAGWKVTVRGLTISLKCSKHGCPGSMTVPMDDLRAVQDPCNGEHVGQYSAKAYENYRCLVAELAHRRRSLGLSQEDICAASGLADGHINKLEAFARTAQLPTLQLWVQTLGLKMVLSPAPLPPATLAALRHQPTPLREVNTHHPLQKRKTA
ncbi:MAG: helix-turn-helix domain-containing protein [Paracoccaceae bacterium]